MTLAVVPQSFSVCVCHFHTNLCEKLHYYTIVRLLLTCTVWRALLVTSFELYPSLCVCGFVFLCAGVTVSKDANYNTECAKHLYARLWLT